MNFGQFRFGEPALTLFANRQKVSLFRLITWNVPPIFFCGGDVMTIGPMATGHHEPEVLEVLAFLARAGFDRALIDIGANIGLMTYHSQSLFRSFHCFEPNPRIFHVLSANLFDCDQSRLHLHNFGLGDRDETGVLSIPQRNQGGAFITGQSNTYGVDILHDHKHTDGGVRRLEVTVRRGRDVFADLFDQMPDGNFVVKIDTEGFEQTILREIAAATPDGARIAIVFENFDPILDAPDFLRTAFGEGTALKLTDNVAERRSRLAKELIKLTRGKVFRLTDRPADWLGTVVLIVTRRSHPGA